MLESGLEVESVAPADDDVNSVYQYLIGGEGGTHMNQVWMRQIGGVLRLELKKTFLSQARLVDLLAGARSRGAGR